MTVRDPLVWTLNVPTRIRSSVQGSEYTPVLGRAKQNQINKG
jgi:hypothetical protein